MAPSWRLMKQKGPKLSFALSLKLKWQRKI